MAIENEVVLRKMRTELDHAMGNPNNQSSLREHVRAIKLLCDLMLDDEDGAEKVGNTVEPTELEWRKMVGDISSAQNKVSAAPSHQKQKLTDDGEANGDSIFDF